MNSTFNFSNLNNFSYSINSNSNMANVIIENCNTWTGRTYQSHLIYMQILLVMFVIMELKSYWNPKISLKIPIEFGREIKIFKWKFNKIWLIHWDEMEILKYVNALLFLVLVSYIGNIFLIQYMVFESRSYWEILKLLIGVR